MRKSHLLRILGVAALGAAGLCAISSRAVLAGTATTSLSVTATVANNCTISTAALAFGSYDPIVTHASANLDGTGTTTITCTKGAVTTVGLNLGSNASGSTRRMASGSNYLTYEIYKDSARTQVWGSSGADLYDTGTAPSKAPRTFTAYGRVTSAQDVPAASYADTVTATVNF